MFLIFVPIILFWNTTVAQTNSSLYLLFQEDGETMMDSKRSTADSLCQLNFHFDLYPQKLRSDPLDFRAKNISQKDTISISELNSLNIRNYNWLKEYYSEYFQEVQEKASRKEPIQIFDLNKSFKQIFIVQIDSLNRYAIITPVEYTEIIQ
ncbi:hypothetical protein LQ318_07840 [Aliifodinibius salicampi]|uniref:Uncharacterized protein n=1 Tax=Fodinibius salicampi TaxID=1920655 RepID=A0ABT3PYA2_9BACT|nr:hypothetical protein [Fodinibius salicampi]MCW9712813.1 hypothetical protein [Fodinibius salicampi]